MSVLEMPEAYVVLEKETFLSFPPAVFSSLGLLLFSRGESLGNSGLSQQHRAQHGTGVSRVCCKATTRRRNDACF